VKRFRVALSPGRDGRSHASVNAAPAADRRFGMAKRIEQSRRHGYHDPRRSSPLHLVGGNTLPQVEPTDPVRIPPTLTLVGGTDVTPPLDPRTSLRI
jgi:hypothetical protein